MPLKDHADADAYEAVKP